MHRMTKHTVIFKIFLVLAITLLFSSCATFKRKPVAEVPAKKPVEQIVSKDVTYPIDVYDPFEGFNRGVYRFNYYFDQTVFLPIVSVYEFILPDYVEDRVTNFFSNLREVRNMINAILQLRPDVTLRAGSRFVINSTAGIGGLWDPATIWGFQKQNEDLGQTFGRYGIGNGPYLVVPIFGPTNLRDGLGFIGDWAIRFAILDAIGPFDDTGAKTEIEISLTTLQIVDIRHITAFRYYETGSPFEYELVRLVYTQKRKMDIAK